METERRLLRHFLAAIAYRTQKALRDAPTDFGDFRGAPKVRTPHELVRHMDSVLGYSRTFFVGGSYCPPVLPTFADAIGHFHEIVADEGLDAMIAFGSPVRMRSGAFFDFEQQSTTIVLIIRGRLRGGADDACRCL